MTEYILVPEAAPIRQLTFEELVRWRGRTLGDAEGGERVADASSRAAAALQRRRWENGAGARLCACEVRRTVAARFARSLDRVD